MSSPEDVDPTFLGFSGFETTAFCTAVLVAFYSLIPNPTGRQTGRDQAEYQVYVGWRWGLIACALQLILIPIVIATQPSGVSSISKSWLVLLMLAPWAPLAGSVRVTLTSVLNVRRMMKGRVTRNEISAILRDRFKFGQRGIALPVIINYMTGGLPQCAIAALQQEHRLHGHFGDLKEQAKEVSETGKEDALELGSLWVMTQSVQPESIIRLHLAVMKYIGTIDPLARWWTERRVPLSVDPMPERKDDCLMKKARFLDVADMLQQGGTVGEELMQRSMMKHFCERCRLATRGAVEAYMESSERSHTDLRAKVWIKDINMDWRGPFERIINVMWEAAFMENRSWKLDYAEDDKSSDFGDRSKVMTTKAMALLFLIVRSMMKTTDEHHTYEVIADVLQQGPYTEQWWVRFWRLLADKIGARLVKNNVCTKAEVMDTDPFPPGAVSKHTRAEFKAVLREIIDQDMKVIVDYLVSNNINSICMQKLPNGKDCLLAEGKVLLHLC